jgi:hypothetical protein
VTDEEAGVHTELAVDPVEPFAEGDLARFDEFAFVLLMD